MKQMTMKDIAGLCGVSIKTVSRVLNNNYNVKEETRQKILDIIQQEGYQVNLLAKGLREKKTNTIIVFIDKHKEKYWGIWHTQMLQHLFKQAKKKGYKIVVSPSSAIGQLNDETDGFHLLSSKMADGAIIFDNAKDDVRIKYLNRTHIPYVLIGQTDDQEVNWVDLNNYKTGYKGGEYLINKGYKRICFMLGLEHLQVNQIRAEGFKEISKEYQLEHNTCIFEIDSMESAYTKTIELFEESNYDALFVSGDEKAIGIYRAVQEMGLKIPDDVAVLGIDNISICKYLYPALTSMDQNCNVFAEKIVDLLDDLINNPYKKVKKQILLENKIIEREST